MKLLIIAGARPNFMKVAPLIKAIQRRHASLPLRSLAALAHRMGEGSRERASGESRERAGERSPPSPQLSYQLIHTGQHYDAKMSGNLFQDLGIPAPDFNLEVGSGSHAVQTANVMTRFEPICLSEKPDWVVVVGDVNSTVACTLVAAKLGIRVAHVEAGLRSFDRTMPEEINRVVTDALADLLLTPSEDAGDNLRHEGIPEAKVRLVGNIMIDALVENLDQARRCDLLNTLGLKDKAFIYVTLHRPSNVDNKETLGPIMTELVSLSKKLPVIFPMHPRTRKMLAEFKIEIPPLRSLVPLADRMGEGSTQIANLLILDPIGYHDSLSLTENARLVLTDSGGLQEESTFFRTPCLTLRPNTERPITVTLGSNRLTNMKQLHADLEQTLKAEPRLGKVPPLWDGKAAERIIEALLET